MVISENAQEVIIFFLSLKIGMTIFFRWCGSENVECDSTHTSAVTGLQKWSRSTQVSLCDLLFSKEVIFIFCFPVIATVGFTSLQKMNKTKFEYILS